VIDFIITFGGVLSILNGIAFAFLALKNIDQLSHTQFVGLQFASALCFAGGIFVLKGVLL
jgi:hypothetical protein